MNTAEARLLHGLYYHREIVGEELPYTAAELNWLINIPIPKGKSWLGDDGKLKCLETEADNYLATVGATSSAAARPLAYLQESGYLSYKKDSSYFRIAVTGRGADVARELDTLLGRANLLYKKHKDGVLWLIATVLVSLITALLTNRG